MKKTLFSILVLVLSSFFLFSGCQSTPETEIVSTKESGTATTVSVSPNNENDTTVDIINFPERWQENFEGQNLTVIVDASLKTPDYSGFMLQTVVPSPYTAEDVKRIKDTLFPNTIAYDTLQENIWTKSDIEEEIISGRQVIAEIKADSSMSEEQKQELIMQREEWLEQLEGMYADAPEAVEAKEVTINDKLINEGAILKLAKQDSVEIAGNMMIGGTEGEGSMLASLNIIIPSFANWKEWKAEGTSELTISEDDAKAFGDEMVNILGAENIVLDRIEKIESRSGERYQVIYVKNYMGLPETYVNPMSFENLPYVQEPYDIVWEDESVIMEVDDSGVKKIEWRCPAELNKLVSDTVQFLPFEQIQEKFRKQINLQGQWFDETNGIIGRKIFIDDIRLGVMKLKSGDRNGYTMTPVWDFFGYSIDKYAEQQPGGYQLDENMEHTNQMPAQSFLTINALDGTVVDRRVGY